MIPNELYAKILPGEKLNTLESLGAGIFIDAIFCDGGNTKIAALARDYPNTLDGKVVLSSLDKANVTSDTTTNVYAADNSHTVAITTPVVQGMFKEVYVDSTSEPVRVHIIKG
jgi:hypothetical protein